MLRALPPVLLLFLAGCSGLPVFQDYAPDPNEADCHFPDAVVGSNAYIVGGVVDGTDEPLANVTLRATPEGDGDVVEDTTNDAGCFFLSVAGGKVYAIRASLEGYQTIERRGVAAETGEKHIIDLRLDWR